MTDKTAQAVAILRFAAQTIELFDDAAMNGDYMLSSTDCASILAGLESYPFTAPTDGVRRGMERAADIADQWAAARTPDGGGLALRNAAAAIREAAAALPAESDAREQAIGDADHG